MAFSTPYTFTALELLTAAKMNAIQANITAIWVGTTAGDTDYYTSSTAKSRLAIGAVGNIYGSSGSAPRWVDGTRYIQLSINGEIPLTTGDGQSYFEILAGLNGYNVTAVSLSRKSGTGVPNVMLTRYRSGVAVNVLSTAVTIDSGELSSATAATPPVINAANDDLATGDFLRADVDGAGTSTLYCSLIVGVKLP